jgi:mannose-6-phosphate isomerase-like protein (cupin superfamily)
MAYWKCNAGGTSEEHVHDFDEYFVVVQGMYIVIINSIKYPINAGQEYFIQKGVPHAGEFIAGTRTIHCFGGQRVKKA